MITEKNKLEDGAEKAPDSKPEGHWIKIADFEVFVPIGKDEKKIREKYMTYLRRKRKSYKLTKHLPGRIAPEKVNLPAYKIHD